MFRRRWIVVAAIALLAVVVISTAGGQAQQSAWMQGYMAGRLSSGGDGAALAPYMMPGSPFAPSFGQGHGFGLFIGLGFVALAFVILTRGGRHGERGQRRREWHERMREEARRWHEQGAAPWDKRPDGDEGSEQRV